MALKFNCSKCGEIIAVKYVKPGVTVYCGKCRAGNVVPESAMEIPNEQVDVDSKQLPKEQKIETSKAEEKIAKVVASGKAMRLSIGGVIIGAALSFLVPSQILFENGLERWMVILIAAIVLGTLGFIIGAQSSETAANPASKNRYPALRVIIGYYRILAGIVIFLTAIICISLFFAVPAGYFLARVLGAMVVGLLGLALFVTLRAMAEGITVFLDIEENTRGIKGA